MTEATGERWLSLPEAAEHLGLAMRSVYSFVHRGELPATGWPMRIRWSDLEDFIRRSRIAPGELRHLYPPGVDDESNEGT